MDAHEDFERTVQLLGALALYAHLPGTDEEFVAVMAPALAASLACGFLPPLPPGYDPTDRPDYPRQGW
ncbi:hypothetical protein ABT009_15995 [Streptomyces sp. NPDC002896]|uniref:hypothetical protein n=1 Tax=Streptomyces sp. NPDC002896 TaxID=3154438 RepID=UPI00332691C7